jgi:putative flippase GtrA
MDCYARLRPSFRRSHLFLLKRSAILIRVRFLIVGLWNTAFSLSMFYLFLKLFKSTNYQVLVLICFFLANIQSHLMQRTFVWKSKEPYFSEIFRFIVNAILISAINFILLVIFVDLFNYPIYETQVFLALLLTIFNYYFQKHSVFKHLKE